MPTLYLCHPPEQQIPGLAAIVTAYSAEGRFAQQCPAWRLKVTVYGANNALSASDLCSMVLASPGAVLFVNPVRGKDFADVRRRLEGRHPVRVDNVYDEATLVAAVAASKQSVDDGHPLIAADIVVALLLMRKLDRELMWSGNNDKGYMWSADIPKGRGLDEKFAGRLPHVMNLLFQAGILISKTSKGTRKWALNPDKRPAIHAILRARSFDAGHADLALKLRQSAGQYSARELDLLNDLDVPAR